MSGLSDPALILCIGCGARVPEIDGPGPTHAYMAASPGCWALYGEVAAREYADPAYRAAGRQIVDAYAVQHPGINERRAVQSVWVHLASLCLVLERGLTVEQSIAAMHRLLAEPRHFEWLPPPASLGEVTVVDVHAADDATEHVAAARSWCGSAWAAWAPHHAAIRARSAKLIR